MAINLKKGENAKLESGQSLVRVGISWDANSSNGVDFDLDVMAVELTSKDGNALGDDYVVFYNSAITVDGKPSDPENAVIHSGDNRNGAGDGDDEVISIDLLKLNPRVNAIKFIINIYEGKARGQNFGQVRNSKARLYYGDSNVAELVYDLEEDYSSSICMEFCMLYKINGIWKFKALGEGNTNDLSSELLKLGIPSNGNA